MTGASATGDLCIPDTQNSNTSTETTILAVNAENGGGLTPRKTRLIPPAINNGGNNTSNCKNINGKIMCPNGYTFPGPLVPTYLDGKKSAIPRLLPTVILVAAAMTMVRPTLCRTTNVLPLKENARC